MKWLTFLPVKLKKRKQKYDIRYKLNAFTHTHTQAIGARTHLQSIAKQREAQKRQIHSLIAEKKTQLER